MNFLKAPILILLLFTGLFTLSSSSDAAGADPIFELTLEELMEVKIVSASKQPETFSQIPASGILITRAEIERYGYQTLVEILAHVPGLYEINDWQNFGSNFGVRGFWSDIPNRDLTILINGVKQSQRYMDANDLNLINIPVHSIERIEIIRGPMAVVYGTGAFFGAINIITNKEIASDNENKVEIRYGTYNTRQYSTSLRGKSNEMSYSLLLSKLYTDGPDVPYSRLGAPGSHTTEGVMDKELLNLSLNLSYRNLSANISYDENI